MIKRSRREHCLQLCEQNPDWNTLDLGCGRDGIKLVNVYADIENYESDYPGKRFVQTVANDTPFEDKEFDFVFCNHIAEHVTDPAAFCKELVRISKRGFIEVPMPFFDNLVVGNSNPPPQSFSVSVHALFLPPTSHHLKQSRSSMYFHFENVCRDASDPIIADAISSAPVVASPYYFFVTELDRYD